jgi:hypothetical protein
MMCWWIVVAHHGGFGGEIARMFAWRFETITLIMKMDTFPFEMGLKMRIYKNDRI